MDVMGTVGFGRELHMQSRPDNRYMPRVIAKLQKWTSAHIQSPSFARLGLDKIFYPQQFHYGRKLLEQVRTFVERRSHEKTGAKDDIFSFLVDAIDPETGEHLSVTELWSEAKFLMIVLGEPITATISAILFYLSRNSGSYAKVVTEIRTSFADAAEIHSGSAMDSCVFLNACIKESLRMSPTSGDALWREVEIDELLIDGHRIPKGCDVGTSIYAIHHKEDYFPDSYAFRPERWLHDHSEAASDTVHAAWAPFSLGNRICIGQAFAMAEIRDVLALLVWHLDFRKASNDSVAKIGEGVEGAKNGRHRVNEFQTQDHIVSQVRGPFLEFRRRQS
ncbi:MAG: hypothetical protein M1822_008058 [Bathelium mastoideum]|nr:MAG: hypothetical protein M1822_008058 [Bathelium mastoideum]